VRVEQVLLHSLVGAERLLADRTAAGPKIYIKSIKQSYTKKPENQY